MAKVANVRLTTGQAKYAAKHPEAKQLAVQLFEKNERGGLATLEDFEPSQVNPKAVTQASWIWQ